ncbi:hypothetical protein GUJ93_ZPchr0005g16331 [Zizania palustris]|uniref:Uncharacterized protein n=1 Tax=Zizania palustris TaxID=103762 RepID=A0A8J5W0N2_ZIZPA|nr:hypothetical protein GUJ93_ZPchr0005g16331 [Zizania palustris]
MKHSMATEGLSRDSFPSPSPPAAAAAAAAGESASCVRACGGGADAECGGGSGTRGCVVVVVVVVVVVDDDGGESGGGVSCARRGDARPHGLGGTGGFRWGHVAAALPAPARRCSRVRFAAGDGDLRPGRSPDSRRGGGGGEGDARPPPCLPALGTAGALSRLARPSSPDTARFLAGFPGDRSGPVAVVVTDDSDAASDFSLTACSAPTSLRARHPSLTLPPPPCFALVTFSPSRSTDGIDLVLAVGVSESTSLTFSSSVGGGSRASTRRRGASASSPPPR